MDVLRFIFSEHSLKVTSPPPEQIPSVIPNWDLLQGSVVSKEIAEKVPTLSNKSALRLGVICHAYNVNSALLSWVKDILDTHDISALVFTTDLLDKKVQLEKFLDTIKVRPSFCKILLLPNFGRDVVPFWKSLQEIGPFADVFLKIHWKKSPHLDLHFPQSDNKPACDAWNEDLYSSLIPKDAKDMHELLQLFDQHKLSCVFPRPWEPLTNLHWHSTSNIDHAAIILKDLDCPAGAILIPLVFPAGNMFYGSTHFFLEFINHFLNKEDYPSEPLAADGTVLHAIERIYTLLSASKGFNVAVLMPPVSAPGWQECNAGDGGGRRFVVFPVAELLSSHGDPCSECQASGVTSDAHAPISLPYLYQSLITQEAQRLIKANTVLRYRMKWLSPKRYPRKMKAWLMKQWSR
jgi:hypothetical protein